MTDSPECRVQLTIKGKVQGVFYRQSTKEYAHALGLKGWVKNEKNGQVLIQAQGQKDKLDSLIAWCWQGPPSAKVSDIGIEWLATEPESDTFQITY